MHTQDRHKGALMMCYITAIPVAHMHIVVPYAIPIYATQEIPCYRKAPFFWPQMLQQARGHMLVEKHTIDIKGKGTLQI